MRKGIAKMLAVLVVLCMVLCLAACGRSKVDEDQRRLDELQKGYEQAARRAEEARQEYNKLQEDIANIERLQRALGNGK